MLLEGSWSMISEVCGGGENICLLIEQQCIVIPRCLVVIVVIALLRILCLRFAFIGLWS